jgi:hypothetical protein
MTDRSIFEYVGYFDNPTQDLPAYHMGKDQLCPVCHERVGALKKYKALMPYGGERSFFFYYHDECAEDMEALTAFEHRIIDADIHRGEVDFGKPVGREVW